MDNKIIYTEEKGADGDYVYFFELDDRYNDGGNFYFEVYRSGKEKCLVKINELIKQYPEIQMNNGQIICFKKDIEYFTKFLKQIYEIYKTNTR